MPTPLPERETVLHSWCVQDAWGAEPRARLAERLLEKSGFGRCGVAPDIMTLATAH